MRPCRRRLFVPLLHYAAAAAAILLRVPLLRFSVPLQRGCFLFGNHIPDVEMHIENLFYANMVALHSQWMTLDACNFTEKNMKAKDKKQQVSNAAVNP